MSNKNWQRVKPELASRILKQLPISPLTFEQTDQTSVVSAMQQIETAHWKYEDVLKNQLEDGISLAFSDFAFIYLPDLSNSEMGAALKLYSQHKKKKPIIGAILLNDEMTKVLLVKNTNSESWSFPKGKKEGNEDDVTCAIREVMEETNYDISHLIKSENRLKHRRATFFIVRGVSETTIFTPWRRGEIKGIDWHPVSSLSKGADWNIYIRHVYSRLKTWIDKKHRSEK